MYIKSLLHLKCQQSSASDQRDPNNCNFKMAYDITIEEFLDSLDPAERTEAMKPTFMEPLKLLLEGYNQLPNRTEEGRNMMMYMLK